jgi:hypothetical protein
LEQEIMTFLSEKVEICLEEGCCIGMGRVQQVEAFHQGTRGARVRIHVNVERQLQGTLPREISFLSFGGPDTAKPGEWLLFAVGEPPPGTQAASLLGFIPVPEDRGEEVVRIHQQLLDKARKTRTP